MGPFDRVVVLVDMDCFYCQVEEKQNPLLAGQPIAVVQYNEWKGGGIIAVNYPARARGVTRHMRGNEAREKCPEIQLCKVPEVRGKADLTKFRKAGKEVANVLQSFTTLLERASIDEAYLDITEEVENRLSQGIEVSKDQCLNTFIVGMTLDDFINEVQDEMAVSVITNNAKLAVGAVIVEEIRHKIFMETGYQCSAGIAHNKILAKLVCGINKPNKQTVVPQECVSTLYSTMPITKIKSLGGKFGTSLSEELGIKFMGELAQISEETLAKKCDTKTASWLCNIAKGINMEPVTSRVIAKSIGCCKRFAGLNALTDLESVEHWMYKLSEEMNERLSEDYEENQRRAKQIVISFTYDTMSGERNVSSSRTQSLRSYDIQCIHQIALDVLKKYCQRPDGSFNITFLGLNANNFEDLKQVREITTFFQRRDDECSRTDYEDDNNSNKQNISHDDNSGTSEVTLAKGTIESSFFFNYLKKWRMEKAQRQQEQVASSSNVINPVSVENTGISSKSDHIIEETGECEDSTTSFFMKCPMCKKTITRDSMPSHYDYHYALELSKQLRETNAVNESKENQKQGCSKSSRALDKFLSSTSRMNLPSTSTCSEFETCPDCEKPIRLDELEHHADFHAAKRLHLELNKPDNTPVRHNKVVVKCKNKGTIKCHTVDSFFKNS